MKPPLQYPGQLPSLGLSKYRNQSITRSQKPENPFSVQRETEKLLVARERERENKDMNRVQQEELRVFEKGIATRQNRAGVIREIQGIRD